jgi:O-antigen/teichoic acid export membrane protein
VGEIKNQAVKNSIVSYSGALLGFVNFIILLPYVFRPEQIGLTRLLQNAAYLIVPLAEFGIISIVLRYYPVFKSESSSKFSFIFYCLAGALAGFLFFTASFVFFKDDISRLFIEKSPLVIEYYYYIIPLVFFIVFTGIFEAVANSLYKTVLPNFLREVLLRFAVSVLAILYVMHLINFQEFIRFFVLGYCLPLFFLILYLFRLNELKINFSLTRLAPSVIKEMATYGFFVILGSSGHLLVNYIDTMMLGALLGLQDTGIYVTAFYMAVIIEIPRRSIRQIAVPFISEAWKKKDMQQIKDIYSKTALNQLIIGAFIFLGVWINIDEIFELMPNGSIYQAGKYVVLFVMIGKLIDMAAGVNGEVIALSKLFRFNIYSIIILAILVFATNLLLIPVYGMVGAAIATTLSLLFYNFIKYLFLKIKVGLQPFSLNTIKAIILAGICFVIVSLVPDIRHPLLSIIIKSGVLALVFLLPLYYFKISEDVNQSLNSLLKKIKRLF